MPSEIQILGKLIAQFLGVVIQIHPNGYSLQGKTGSPNGPVASVTVEYKPREGYLLTFDIATIPPEEKLLTAPILQAIFGPFPGVFTVKSSPQGVTIYYRLQYAQISFGLQGSTQIVQDLEQIKQTGEEIYRHLPITKRSEDSKMLFEGLSQVRYVEPVSPALADRLNAVFPGDPSILLDALLGQRILFLEVVDFHHRNLILGWLANRIEGWHLSIGRFLPLRFSDHDILNTLAKVPFALAADMSCYAYQHLTEEMEKLTKNVHEISKPLIGILPVGHPVITQEIPEGVIVSLKDIAVDPDLWLDYFLEAYQPAISRQQGAKIISEVAPAWSSFSRSEIKPGIIESCIHRYFSRLRNKDDHLKSMKEYLFKILET